VHRRFTGLLHPRVRQVYGDDALWVLNKPAGVLSHPNPPARQSANALLRCGYDVESEAYLTPAGDDPRDGAAAERPSRVFLIHRLDQDTSGLILCAFDEAAAATLKAALARREMHKRYLALVLGIPRVSEGTWRDCLQKRTRRGRAEVAVVKGRPNAMTRFRTLKVFAGACAALVELTPETGRTHQLRVQAASRKLPILGDDRYGDFAANRRAAELVGLRRMFLHAQGLELRHPVTGDKVAFDAALDESLAGCLTKVGQVRKPLRVAPSGKRRPS
jgi:23S rRNA pseudouridine1911/1915/1917 synthase